MTRGAWTELDGSWLHPTAMTAVGDTLYIAEGTSIWRVAADGAYEAISEDPWEPRALVGIDDVLISIEKSGSMYRVAPADGAWTLLDGDWSNTVAICAGGDQLFAVEGTGTLCRVAIADGSWQALEGTFPGVAHLVAAGNTLLAFEEGGNLYRVSPKDGAWVGLDSTWPNTTAAAGDPQRAYTVTGNGMYAIDPATGEFETLNDDIWQTRFLTVMGGALYSIEQGGGLYRIDLA